MRCLHRISANKSSKQSHLNIFSFNDTNIHQACPKTGQTLSDYFNIKYNNFLVRKPDKPYQPISTSNTITSLSENQTKFIKPPLLQNSPSTNGIMNDGSITSSAMLRSACSSPSSSQAGNTTTSLKYKEYANVHTKLPCSSKKSYITKIMVVRLYWNAWNKYSLIQPNSNSAKHRAKAQTVPWNGWI